MDDHRPQERHEDAEVRREARDEAPPQSGDADLSHLDPSWIWFASSAFPMISGTLGPVASAFSICSLVRPWRQLYPPGSDIQRARYVGDPVWLTAVNAVQLVVAVVANLFLLLNMARRLRFSLAQPVTIVGWYISSLSLIALAATAAGPLQSLPPRDPGRHGGGGGSDRDPDPGHVWSQAFYYGIYAAALYFIVASLMTVTFLGAYAGFYDKDFMLTTSQRTLMLQTILFLVYLLGGALVFSSTEDWSYLDAVYWADVTLFTVGFGDLAAQSTLGRALLFPYALVGVVSLGLVVGSIRSLMLDRAKRRLDARMIENNRRRRLRRMARTGRDGVLEPIRGDGDDDDDDDDDRHGGGGGGGGGDGDGNGNGNGNGVVGSKAGGATAEQLALAELERRRQEFLLMRKIQRQAARRRRWTALAVSTSTWLVLWLVGARIFQASEAPYQHWSYFDAFYLCFVSLTTIGYGDVTPISNAGKSFFVFWSLLALPTMTVLISNAGDTLVKGIRDATNWLGTVTILPGERGFQAELKEVMRTLSCGQVFDEEVEESPPGFLGNAQPLDEEEEEEEEEEDDDDEGAQQTDRERDQAELDAEKRGGRRAENHDGSDSADGSEKAGPASQSANGNTPLVGRPRSAGNPSSPSGTTGDEGRGRGGGGGGGGGGGSGPEGDAENDEQRGSRESERWWQLRRRRQRRRRQGGGDAPGRRRPSLVRQPPPLPDDPQAYRVVLIEEIARVTRHLKERPPRQYSFAEWVWYLKLIGEDESCCRTHARPRLDPLSSRGGGGRAAEDDEKNLQWSWVGARSPLMSSREEAEWILDKLIERLEEELRHEAARRASGNGTA